MQWKVLTIVLTGLSVLCATSCSVSNSATSEVSSFSVHNSKDSVRVELVMVAVHDTVMETKTITIILRQTQDTATARLDTVFTSVVTDRERIRNAADVRSQKVEVRVEHDTVFVAVRDSTMVSTTNLTNPTNLGGRTTRNSTLKWFFALVIAVIVLIVVIKIKW